MPTTPAPDSVTEQLDHAAPDDAPRVPLVVCDDCGCIVVPEAKYLRIHERVCPGATKAGTLSALMHRVLGITPGPKP